MLVLDVVRGVATAGHVMYVIVWSVSMIPSLSSRFEVELRKEMRWMCLTCTPVKNALLIVEGTFSWWITFFVVLIDFVYMTTAYLDKDDRWKRRRKKIASRVKQIAGKLVVVPIPVTQQIQARNPLQ